MTAIVSILFAALLLFPSGASSEPLKEEVRFKADWYARDFATNTAKGRGNAWLQMGDREIWADELEFDFNTGQATARGNVHIRSNKLDAWGRQANYNSKTEETLLEDATILMDMVVVTGSSIHRLDSTHFEVENGTFSNCNLDLVKNKDVTKCTLDWKIYGRKFSITLEGYIHVTDALVYVRSLPVLYTPYFVGPMKSKRQSGFLWYSLFETGSTGLGLSLPYFVALAPWHDVLVTPTYYLSAGYHLAAQYRYIYDSGKKGTLSVFTGQRIFSALPDTPTAQDGTRSKTFGLLGDSAIVLNNQYALGGRAFSRQIVRLVSHPYYTFDFANDLGAGLADLGYLRSQLAATFPSDHWLFTGQVQYFQSLMVSKDSGADGGGVVELPTLTASRTSTPFLGPWFLTELDVRFSNFYRSSAFDQIPDVPAVKGPNLDINPLFDSNDFLRTGLRFSAEPRLLANVPMPPGFQLQPLLRAGAVAYRFSEPTSQAFQRHYVDIEIPFTLYLSKMFETGISGFEKVSHVFQPRVLYAATLIRNDAPDHPFFQPNPLGLPQPRFDLRDQLTPFEYFRFELINRFRRRDGESGNISRFLLLQLSQQYNLRTSNDDVRYFRKLGPIELLAEVNLGRFMAQMQGKYQLEKTAGFGLTPVRENEYSGTLGYSVPGGDRAALSTILRERLDPNLTEELMTLSFFKTLPTFFDVDGTVEYNLKNGDVRGYSVGMYFRAKPRSCWEVSLTTGRNVYRVPFVRLSFNFLFGDPQAIAGK